MNCLRCGNDHQTSTFWPNISSKNITLIYNRSVRGISSEALKMLMDYAWPGNVRQLDAVIEKAVLVAAASALLPPTWISPNRKQMPPVAPSILNSPRTVFPLEEIERQVILKAMEKSEGCIAEAARLLHTTYRTVEYRVKKHGIPRAINEMVKPSTKRLTRNPQHRL